MSKLDDKINDYYAGLVVRKDLVKTVKGNAIVPSYVLEYLLGQYCATNDNDSINSGIQTVKEILSKHYVHRNEAGLIRSTIKEKGRHKVIDKVSVSLNEKSDTYEAEFSNLGIKKVLIDSGTIKTHPKLLVGSVWCICDLEYEHTEDNGATPWILGSIKPIQLSHFDYDGYLEARKKFDTDEWIDLLMQSMGFEPEMFGKRSKMLQLARLIPYCERNYNIIELGPKGTGKSHIYSEFSPHGILISGGEVSVPKLFVNNSNGKLGLVGYWNVVAFDEFAGQDKKVDKALVDIMKNYMANKTFSRGIETLGAEASMVFVGNTAHSVPYMLKHTDLFEEVPGKYHDSAFLDRLHFYLPGWEIDIIRGEMFSSGYGFVVDYIAEILRSLRNDDYSDRYKKHFTLSNEISTRDRDAINKTFSGLMKIIFPHDEATVEEIEEILKFAIEGRKRVKDQLMRIDSTYVEAKFYYEDNSGRKYFVTTLEEDEYPNYYHKTIGSGSDETIVDNVTSIQTKSDSLNDVSAEIVMTLSDDLSEKHLTFKENQRGVTFDSLFGKYLTNAKEITLTDPYVRIFYQARNLMEFMETIAKYKPEGDIVKFHLITIEDEFKGDQQGEFLQQVKNACQSVGIDFTWEYDVTQTIHARHIETDHGWKISLDRGLDIFQQYDMNDAFNFSNRLQQFRTCKAFEITYMKK
ncbi:BREX system Lon protease-like protein BrxL [Sulfuricurvum sp.]|uniref:BREX system Lon protease-like protein BrxL n=1 Tax=Sulfuricurvum sp. TaxID=2025608 RepID=UPI0026174764|nr:BREX system Lon protease-like protein BrxL [Sulfuricurvum sp.]MDD4950493.1 BREX system Lon protease-like protein BrxL [Sulfuricurvum sp.]